MALLQTISSSVDVVEGERREIVVDSLSNCDVVLQKDSELLFVALLSKGWDGRIHINFRFLGENARLKALFLIAGKNSEKFAFDTYSYHNVPHTQSDYSIRSALFDRSTIDYHGNLIIQPHAQLTNTHLAHHSLLLSRFARAKTIPSLEILADDVKAGHSATIGRVDDDMLFYLQSRGLDKKEAVDMLVRGFLLTDVEKVENSNLRSFLTAEAEDMLNMSNVKSQMSKLHVKCQN